MASSTASVSAQQVLVSETVVGSGHECYLPFDVPEATAQVTVTVDAGDAPVGLALFDARGPGYRSPGFRGVSGSERTTVTVGLTEATPGFLSGPMPAGRWHVLVPVLAAPTPTEVTARITLAPADHDQMERAAAAAAHAVDGGAATGAVDAPGWYRGDLHAHTVASSDAWSSGSALDAAGWAHECRHRGLHFASLTDHNVVAQNREIAAASGDGVLLLAGEEVTSWSHGHATASGLPVDAWLDWRNQPGHLPLGRHQRRVTALVRAADELGAYLAAAHPLRDPLGWQFFADAEQDPAAMPHGLEVWNGAFAPVDRAAVAYWDALLQRGWRVAANGGSDMHGMAEEHRWPGAPTTVVHAAALRTDTIVAALRDGRSFIMAAPDGVEVYLEAEGPGGQTAMVGGVVAGRPDDRLPVRAVVRNGAGTDLSLIAGGAVVDRVRVATDDETVSTHVPAHLGYVRAEVRRAATRAAGGATQETITNPVWFEPATRRAH